MKYRGIHFRDRPSRVRIYHRSTLGITNASRKSVDRRHNPQIPFWKSLSCAMRHAREFPRSGGYMPWWCRVWFGWFPYREEKRIPPRMNPYYSKRRGCG